MLVIERVLLRKIIQAFRGSGSCPLLFVRWSLPVVLMIAWCRILDGIPYLPFSNISATMFNRIPDQREHLFLFQPERGSLQDSGRFKKPLMDTPGWSLRTAREKLSSLLI